MISVEEAQKIILEHTVPNPPKRVSLQEALGLVLAEEVIASHDLPPFTSSAMDGYALRSGDTARASETFPCRLQVVEDLPAGKVARRKVKAGTCARIMTGGLVPNGADAVLMLEETELTGEEVKGRLRSAPPPPARGLEPRAGTAPDTPGKPVASSAVKIKRIVSAGENIRYQGEDIRKGKTALEKGTVINAQQVALLAALGVSRPLVFPRATVAILSTGNELVPVSKKLSPGKIRDSNSHTLEALLRQTGADPVRLGIAKDSPTSLRKKIREGLAQDLLLVAGGISVGAYDLVKKVFLEEGVGEIFWKVNVKPGKPLFFGKRGKTLVFGLPGNPASSFVSFEIFVCPALRRMMGRSEPFPIFERGILVKEISHRNGRVEFIRAVAEKRNGTLFVRSAGPQGSHCLSSLVQANALIRLDGKTAKAGEGEEVEVLLL